MSAVERAAASVRTCSTAGAVMMTSAVAVMSFVFRVASALQDSCRTTKDSVCPPLCARVFKETRCIYLENLFRTAVTPGMLKAKIRPRMFFFFFLSVVVFTVDCG